MSLPMLRSCLHGILGILLLALVVSQVRAQDPWYPSKYGAQDTLGALNELNPDKTKRAAELVKLGKTYALGVETGPGSPAYSPRTYNVTVLQLDDGMGTARGNNKATGNDDLMTFWMGIGSQIDGLGHMGENHRYYNGNMARDFVTPTGLTKLSIGQAPANCFTGDLTRCSKADGQGYIVRRYRHQ